MMKKPKLSSGATGPQGPAGVQGLQGASGTPGPKFLNGAGDPVTALSNSTVIGDYYLDNSTGNLWQRETYTGTINATTIVLAGNVQWKRASVLKGPAGQNLQLVTKPYAQQTAENQVLEATTDIIGGSGSTKFLVQKLVSADGQKSARIAIAENGKVFVLPQADPGNMAFWLELLTRIPGNYGHYFTEPVIIGGDEPNLILRRADESDGTEKDFFYIEGGIEDGIGTVAFNVMVAGQAHRFMEYYGGNKFLILNGINGVQFPNLTTAQMAAIAPSMTTGFVAFCTTTQKLRVTTTSGWVDLH